MRKKIRQFLYKNERLRQIIEDIDHYLYINRPIKKMAKVIYKCNRGCTPKLSYDDCVGIAFGIYWNDADEIKKYLSYTSESSGDRIFPR